MNKNNMAKQSNTESKQSKKKRQTAGLIPFVKGDPRINRKGRPKKFDDLRKLSQQIANEVATYGQNDKFGNKKGDPIVINGHKVTIAEGILRTWSLSKDARLQMRFVEVAYGKVPDVVEVNNESRPSRIVFVYE